MHIHNTMKTSPLLPPQECPGETNRESSKYFHVRNQIFAVCLNHPQAEQCNRGVSSGVRTKKNAFKRGPFTFPDRWMFVFFQRADALFIWAPFKRIPYPTLCLVRCYIRTFSHCSYVLILLHCLSLSQWKILQMAVLEVETWWAER